MGNFPLYSSGGPPPPAQPFDDGVLTAPPANRKPLVPGDKVTLVLPDHVVMAEVAVSSRSGFRCILTSRKGNSIESGHLLADEGVTWLLGYHLGDSPEVLACRAAKALDKSEKKKP